MKSAPSTSRWKNARRWLPGVLISAVALFLVSRLASWSDLADALKSVQPVNALIAVGLSALSLLIRSAAWKVLLNGKPTISKSFFIINEGYLLNNLFPLRAGEIGRAVFMGRTIGVSPFHVLSTVVIERAFDVAVAAGMLLVTFPLALGLEWAKPVGIITLAVVITFFVVLFLMARFSEKVHDLAIRLGGRWGIFQKYVVPQIDSLLEGLSALRRPSQFLLSVFLIGCSWVLWVAVYYVMLLPIVPTAPVWWAVFTEALLALGVAIPSAPAALGVYEAAMVAALTILGVSAPAALAYAIVLHFIQFALTGVLGLTGFALERRSLASIQTEINLKEST